MKRNQRNIFTVLALGGLMACGPMVRAQDSSAPAPATPPPAAGATPATPATPPTPGAPKGGRNGAVMAILDQLGLTDDQKQKAVAALKEQREQMSAARGDTSLSTEDKKAKRKEINEATDSKLKIIFNPDQYTKFIELRKEQGAHGGGGAPAKKPDANQN